MYNSPVAGDPTLTSLDQISSTAVRVMWNPPSGGATVTGYIVHYKTNSSVGTNTSCSSTKSSSSTSTDITGLTSGAIYTISVEATSQHLSGESEEMTIALSELFKYYGLPIFSCVLTLTACYLACIIYMETWVHTFYIIRNLGVSGVHEIEHCYGSQKSCLVSYNIVIVK